MTKLFSLTFAIAVALAASWLFATLVQRAGEVMVL